MDADAIERLLQFDVGGVNCAVKLVENDRGYSRARPELRCEVDETIDQLDDATTEVRREVHAMRTAFARLQAIDSAIDAGSDPGDVAQLAPAPRLDSPVPSAASENLSSEALLGR